MYKMMIDISGQHRVFEFRGPYCRTKMLERWDDHLRRAEGDADIRSIRVWGTVGNKTEIMLAWPPERLRRRTDLRWSHQPTRSRSGKSP